MAFDFSHLQASPAHSGRLDFTSLGAIPAVGDGSEESTSMLGAAGRGFESMIPLGEQAHAGIESAVDNTTYAQEREELRKDVEADKANHPGARLAGQVAGVAAPALLTGGASLPGGALAEGALYGAGFGAGNAIDTISEGGSAEKAAGDLALGTLAGGAGGAAGKALGNVITKVSKPFVNSQDEILAEATNHILGGTARQVRSLPGKNPVDTLVKMGKDMARYRVNGEPLVAVTDQYGTRLNKFIALDKQAGSTIGNTIKTANVAPMSSRPIIEEMNAALKYGTPDDQAQMKAVADQIGKYADTNGNLTFERLQQLKSELGERAFEGEGSEALKASYHVVSDIQDRELEKIASTINKPEFDDAKNAYHLTSRAIPLLRMAVAKELAGKTNLFAPGLALLANHPVVAAGALMKNRLGQMGSGAIFKGAHALPAGAGEAAAVLPGKVGGQVGAANVQNMGEPRQLPGHGPKVVGAMKREPNKLNIDHPAMGPWRNAFQKNAESAKNPGELEKAHAVTDFVLSQRDPAYAAAKQKMADEPMPEAPVTPKSNMPEPIKMAEGGVVDPLTANRDRIEPGVMGETEPPEQKFLNAMNAVAAGAGAGQLAGGVLKTGMAVAKSAPRILGNEIGAVSIPGKMAPKMEGAAETGIEAYVKGVQKGPNGDVKIWGVKGPPELLKKHFGDEAPGSVPEHVLREKGLLPETKDLSRMNAPNNFAKGGKVPFNPAFAGLRDLMGGKNAKSR